jgi:phosphoserine phosphatase RsbU/P
MPEPRAIIGNIAPYLRLLREHAIFRELPEPALKDLAVRGDLFAFAESELMLRQGDASDSAWLLTQGEVDIVIDGPQGPVLLGQAAAGALIGEIGVFADVARTASVRTRTRVEALRIGRADMLQIGGENPAFLRAVMKQLGARIAAFNQAIAFYSQALDRLEQQDFDPNNLELAPQAFPEIVGFAYRFRRMAERIGLRRSGALQ